MGGTLFLDPLTRQFESGMPRLVLQSGNLSRGTLTVCCPFLTLPMDAISSLDPETRQFESGIPRMVLEWANFVKGIPTMSSQLFALLMGGISSLDPVIRRSTCQPRRPIFPPSLLPRLFRPDGQTQRVGSETPWAVYSIGYIQTVAQDSIHLLSSQFLSHTQFGQFLFNLKTLSLEPLGPKFTLPHVPNVPLSSDLCVYRIVLITFWLWQLSSLLPVVTLLHVAI